MRKRAVSLVLAIILAFSLLPMTLAIGEGLSSFRKVNTYTSGKFTDVPVGDWYAQSVKDAYEYDLVKGESESKFSPAGSVNIAAAITLACRLHSIYYTGESTFVQGDPWYQVYVDYAITNGIIRAGEYTNMGAKATRVQYAAIMSKALPDSALQAINRVDDNAIPDVKMTDPHAADIYRLYRAGILTGSDTKGTFNPQSDIKRAEVAALVTRMADPSLRKSVTLTSGNIPDNAKELTAQEIFAKCSPAVAYVSVYNSKGTMTASGSGFFVDSNGTLFTNYHVIDGCSSAKIETSDTHAVYDVLGVYSYNIQEDWAVLKVDCNTNSFLERGEKSTIAGGAVAYAIGSPLGFQNTISQGIISNPNRVYNGMTYIQTDAAISHGSSGGALINKYGDVIGITCGSFEDGQNLNLAIPVSYVTYTTNSGYMTLEQIAKENKPVVEDPVALLKSYLMFYGKANFMELNGVMSTIYTLDYTTNDGKTYRLSYADATQYTFISESYSSILADVTTTLYFDGAGTDNSAAIAMYSYLATGASPSLNIGYGRVYRAHITQTGEFSFYSWFGDGYAPKASCEFECYKSLLNIIYIADDLFAYFGIPLTMEDFGYVY